jgi:hypothetical protein
MNLPLQIQKGQLEKPKCQPLFQSSTISLSILHFPFEPSAEALKQY